MHRIFDRITKLINEYIENCSQCRSVKLLANSDVRYKFTSLWLGHSRGSISIRQGVSGLQSIVLRGSRELRFVWFLSFRFFIFSYCLFFRTFISALQFHPLKYFGLKLILRLLCYFNFLREIFAFPLHIPHSVSLEEDVLALRRNGITYRSRERMATTACCIRGCNSVVRCNTETWYPSYRIFDDTRSDVFRYHPCAEILSRGQ